MTKQRNDGIDFLKIVSFFYVLILHTLGQGGILATATVGGAQYNAGWFLEIAAYCSGDLFALMSGYVGYTEKERTFSIKPYVNLWLRVVFLSALVDAIFLFINPALITKAVLLKTFLPVSNWEYWYISAYTGLFFAAPILNHVVRTLSDTQLKRVFAIIMVVFSSYGFLVEGINGGYVPFGVNKGYSFVWITMSYLIGAIIKKCRLDESVSTKRCIWWLVLSQAISFGWLVLMTYLPMAKLGHPAGEKLFLSYAAPTIMLIGIAHVILFSRMPVGPRFSKVIRFLAPGAISAYLLNCQPILWDNYWKDLFAGMANWNVVLMVFAVLVISAVYVVITASLDQLRALLFKALKINVLADKINAIFMDKIVPMAMQILGV